MALKRKRALPPTHPGEILREDVLPALDLSVMQAAAKLGVTRQTLHRIVARRDPRPVTPVMAVRLGKLCGNGTRLAQPAIGLRPLARRTADRHLQDTDAARGGVTIG